MTNLKPLYDRVIVERLPEEEKTAGGIIIPDTAKEKPTQGKVLAVGAGAVNTNGDFRPMQVKVGDTVLFKKWGAEEIKTDGKEFLILEEKDILAVVNA